MQVEIRQVDVISITKISFILYSILGLIIGVVYVFVALMLGSFLDYAGQEEMGLMKVAATGLGVLLIPLLALLYGCIGAIGGLLFGLFYNLVARGVGGIGMTVSVDETVAAKTSTE